MSCEDIVANVLCLIIATFPSYAFAYVCECFLNSMPIQTLLVLCGALLVSVCVIELERIYISCLARRMDWTDAQEIEILQAKLAGRKKGCSLHISFVGELSVNFF